jgi:tetratricopeptide (TPR) repeat protein
MNTNKTRYDVFISSTSRDLVAYRTAVAAVLNPRDMIKMVMMEEFTASEQDAMSKCRAEVLRSDLLICIYAKRYGYIAHNSNGKSITEWEFRWAEEAGIDRLVFILDSDIALSDDDPINKFSDIAGTDETSQQKKAALANFLGDVQNKLVVKYFNSPSDLALKVNQAVESWEKRQRLPVVVRQPLSIAALIGLLFLVMVMVFGELVVRLLQAGDTAFGLLAAALGLLLSLLPLFDATVNRLQAMARSLKLPGWVGVIAMQVAPILLCFFIRQPLYTGLAQQHYAQAVNATNSADARAAFNSAQILDPAITLNLQSTLIETLDAPASEENDIKANLHAELLYDTGDVAPELLDRLSADAERSIENNDMRVLRYAQVLARLSPSRAARLADDFNDRSVAALMENTIVQARLYALAVLTIDNRIGNERSAEAKSISRLNLGFVYEAENRLEEALDAYRQALELFPANVEARYVLASLLLINANGATTSLQEAVHIAQQGRIYLPPPCDNTEPNPATPEPNWYCFLLLTTEAGARLALNDVPRNIEPLLDRAILLAEQNAQFGDRQFTAEAYYYRASLPAYQDDLQTLCMIIAEYNRDNARHVTWATVANRRLNGQLCTDFSP